MQREFGKRNSNLLARSESSVRWLWKHRTLLLQRPGGGRTRPIFPSNAWRPIEHLVLDALVWQWKWSVDRCDNFTIVPKDTHCDIEMFGFALYISLNKMINRKHAQSSPIHVLILKYDF